MKVFTSKSQRTGELGESLACQYLVDHGYSIIERNYTLKVGEIDIVAKVGETLYFFEVKSRITNNPDFAVSGIRPEENVTPAKARKFVQTTEIYLQNKGFTGSLVKVQCLCVYINKMSMKAKVDILDF